LLLLAFFLIIFTAAGAIYRLFELVIGWFVPRVHTFGGGVLLVLACCPWIGALVVLLITLFDSRI